MDLKQDNILIQRFNQGQVSALQGMYDRYKRDMMTLAWSLVFDKSKAEDALQEVFAKLIAGRGRIKIRSHLRAYLLTAVANEARSLNRTHKGDDSVDMATIHDPERQNHFPDRSAMVQEEQQLLEKGLNRLPYEQREVVVLRHYGQVRFKAIAKMQGVSLSAVQARYRYGLEKLRSYLGGDL